MKTIAVLIWLSPQQIKLFFIDDDGIRVEKHRTEKKSLNELMRMLTKRQVSEWVILGTKQNHQIYSQLRSKEFSDPEVIGIIETDAEQDSEILSIGRTFLQKVYKERKHAFQRRKI